MERSEFAMKFCSIQFTVSEDVNTWRELLHQVATKQREDQELSSNKENRLQQLETLLSQKEALLEAALTAKQKTEDKLVQGFCVVLNAKKDEIKRLQDEVESAQEMQRYGMKPAAKRKAAVMKKTKKMGARLKQNVEEEDEMSEGSSRESGDDIATENEEEDSKRKRAKNEALKAYSQLPANLRSSSVQISSAEDLLSSMDDIIKGEEDDNEAMQRGDNSHDVKLEPLSSPGSLRRSSAVLKIEPTAPPKPVPKPPRPTPPSVDEAMDSEEEDILDMLS
ncbi:Hypothetical protein PHPALM_20958 [Phytophthora palmivora]|uniref:Uncharacterized protein n=1 Tax=Phytophthora palmivora TaxID=4796 RepID=A0A2P4XDI5_9STRA|nr:Hypothetical protein PHPALM_20958 [Phytophthora palmivora]